MKENGIHRYKKLFFGLIKIILLQGNGGYKTQEGRSWYVSDFTLVYKFLGIVFHTVTVNGLTFEQSEELIK